MKLYIANKNYSSWSMRPWVLMTGLGIAFEEVMVPFDFGPDSRFAATLAPIAPTGQVPVLVDAAGFAVWESLAIVEALHERFPAAGVWPADAQARARARSVCAEMHAGFGQLRRLCPMNVEAHLPEVGARLWRDEAGLRANVARVEQLWGDALAASGGPFLFGAFGAADAFFAPVVMRTSRYALPLGPVAQAYAERLEAHPAVQAWIAGALAEKTFVPEDEPYRSAR